MEPDLRPAVAIKVCDTAFPEVNILLKIACSIPAYPANVKQFRACCDDKETQLVQSCRPLRYGKAVDHDMVTDCYGHHMYSR